MSMIEFAKLLFSDSDFTILYISIVILGLSKVWYRAAKEQWHKVITERNELERRYDKYK